jgi:Tfp pilus assembly protein FimT
MKHPKVVIPAIRPRSRPATRRGRRAFTLFELIAVMLLVVTILAMAAPSLSGFYAGRQTDQVGANLVAVTEWARASAVADARLYRLNVDEKEQAFWVTAQDTAGFKLTGQSFGRRVDMPVGVTVKWMSPASAVKDGYVQFDALGATEPATIRLTGRRGVVVDVMCESPTEAFHAVEQHDPQALQAAQEQAP